MSILAVPSGAQEDTAAASGMTSGLPGVSPARQAELMYIRAQAQKARPEAEAAAMARSAEQALDKQIAERSLDEARETKDLKQKAAYDHQIKRAEDAYKGVSQSEISAWGEGSGTVKVQRGVPPQFLASVPPDEPAAEEGGHFGFLKAPGKAAKSAAGGMKKALSWRPFGNDKDENAPPPPSASPPPPPSSYFDQPPLAIESAAYPAPAAEEEKEGFFAKIPFVGVKKKKPGDTSSQEPTYRAPAHQEPPATETGIALASYETAEAEKEGLFSRMPLIGGSNKKTSQEEAPPPAPPAPSRNLSAEEAFQSDAALRLAASSAEEEKTKGFIGRMFAGKKDKSDDVPARGGSGLFGAGGSSVIDPSLFPDPDGSTDRLVAQDLGSEKRRLLKAPDLSGIKVPKITVPNPVGDEAKPSLPKVDRSGTHSGGSRNYVVQTANAQFMRFGDSALNSETLTLGSGQVVEMTKAGDEWSSVRLSNGVTGIMRNKDLRPAKPGEGPVAPAPAVPAPAAVPDFATTVP